VQLRYREITAGERDQFNDFVANAPKGHFLQSWEWGEVKAATGWQPLRILVEAGAEPVAALSILKRPLPGLPYSIFYAPRGPVGDPGNWEALAFLFQATRELARRHRAVFLKIDPDIPLQDSQFQRFLLEQGFRPAQTHEGFEGVQPRFVFRLDTTPDREQLAAALAPKTRYNLRLAEKRGVRLKPLVTRDDLPEFYRLLVETARRDRFLIRGYSYFETIWDLMVEKGMARIFLAEYEGKVIAGTLAFLFGPTVWYLYGASGNQYRNVMPNYLLQWAMINWAKDNHCRLYDFRGVPGNLHPDDPLYGLYRFKKGFGGIYTEFIGEFDLVYRPLLYQGWNWAEPRYYHTVRRYLAWKKSLAGGAEQPEGEAGAAPAADH